MVRYCPSRQEPKERKSLKAGGDKEEFIEFTKAEEKIQMESRMLSWLMYPGLISMALKGAITGNSRSIIT
jgi:hypothetical protein